MALVGPWVPLSAGGRWLRNLGGGRWLAGSCRLGSRWNGQLKALLLVVGGCRLWAVGCGLSVVDLVCVCVCALPYVERAKVGYLVGITEQGKSRGESVFRRGSRGRALVKWTTEIRGVFLMHHGYVLVKRADEEV